MAVSPGELLLPLSLPMQATPVDLFLVVTLLLGLALCGIAADTYRTWNEPGVAPFTTFLLLFGLGMVAGSAADLATPLLGVDTPVWSPIGTILWALITVPWLIFALQYTGTYTQVNRYVVAAVALPATGMLLLFAGLLDLTNPAFRIIGSLSLIYVLSLMIIGCYLVVRTAKRYGHLSLRQGASLATIPLLLFVVVNFSGLLIEETGELAAVVVYTTGIAGCVAATGLALYRYDTFQSTPAVGTIGERAIVRQTEDLMFVLDDEQRVIRLNQTAADRLGVDRTEALGDSLGELLDTSLEELHETETVGLMTDDGQRQFDTVISDLTDQHGRQLGYTLSLHDVTELELREQRLEVLNRVLRHNLRNQVEVIRSNAEFLADRTADGSADSIIESADRLSELGRSARAIDQVVSRPPSTVEVDLSSVLRETVREAGDPDMVELSLSVPDGKMVVTDRQALSAAAESAIENAVSRAHSAVTVTLEECTEGYLLRVSDDGPGVPDEELASVTAGTETPLQHGTGLGLWQLKWAVTKLNGELSIRNDEGTTIEVTIPDQGRDSGATAAEDIRG